MYDYILSICFIKMMMMMMMTNNVGKYYMRFHCYDYQKLVLILYCITIMIIILMVTQL